MITLERGGKGREGPKAAVKLSFPRGGTNARSMNWGHGAPVLTTAPTRHGNLKRRQATALPKGPSQLRRLSMRVGRE